MSKQSCEKWIRNYNKYGWRAREWCDEAKSKIKMKVIVNGRHMKIYMCTEWCWCRCRYAVPLFFYILWFKIRKEKKKKNLSKYARSTETWRRVRLIFFPRGVLRLAVGWRFEGICVCVCVCCSMCFCCCCIMRRCIAWRRIVVVFGAVFEFLVIIIEIMWENWNRHTIMGEHFVVNIYLTYIIHV